MHIGYVECATRETPIFSTKFPIGASQIWNVSLRSITILQFLPFQLQYAAISREIFYF